MTCWSSCRTRRRPRRGRSTARALVREADVSADLFICRRLPFEEERDLIGTLTYAAGHEGVRVYGEHDHARQPGSAGRETRGGSGRTVKDVIEAWLQRAETDILAIKNCLYGPFPSPETAAYHAKQAAEKIIKAGLISAGVHPPKEHALEKLLALFPPGHPLLPLFRPLQHLSPYISAFRYPGSPERPDIPVPSLAEVEGWLPQILAARDAVAAAGGGS